MRSLIITTFLNKVDLIRSCRKQLVYVHESEFEVAFPDDGEIRSNISGVQCVYICVKIPEALFAVYHKDSSRCTCLNYWFPVRQEIPAGNVELMVVDLGRGRLSTSNGYNHAIKKLTQIQCRKQFRFKLNNPEIIKMQRK